MQVPIQFSQRMKKKTSRYYYLESVSIQDEIVNWSKRCKFHGVSSKFFSILSPELWYLLSKVWLTRTHLVILVMKSIFISSLMKTDGDRLKLTKTMKISSIPIFIVILYRKNKSRAKNPKKKCSKAAQIFCVEQFFVQIFFYLEYLMEFWVHSLYINHKW